MRSVLQTPLVSRCAPRTPFCFSTCNVLAWFQWRKGNARKPVFPGRLSRLDLRDCSPFNQATLCKKICAVYSVVQYKLKSASAFTQNSRREVCTSGGSVCARL
ncbi:hypothetical protein Rcas_4337 [Roseiflexus castenholzii DSM 13941]|uniref:Uncharacterized protein n=1 Tax=Roseiflexus castenholzii (strain DSM 13941 / HLO8) TaxID=383372 RepID=A7NS15_ROSCS|nr:hypothetical protein Rcas_4337 [Roseiflexus castenholzii DSM 13941]